MNRLALHKNGVGCMTHYNSNTILQFSNCWRSGDGHLKLMMQRIGSGAHFQSQAGRGGCSDC